jgi:hypothetical protein
LSVKKINLKIFVGLIVAVLLLGSITTASAASTPEQTVAEFYKWYLHEMNQEREPRANKAKISAAVSKRLNAWFKTKEYKEWDADYFIDAQDFDKEWEDSISVSKAVIKGNTATLKVTLGVFKNGRKYQGIGKHVLPIKMVKEAGVWKIDRVGNY